MLGIILDLIIFTLVWTSECTCRTTILWHSLLFLPTAPHRPQMGCDVQQVSISICC